MQRVWHRVGQVRDCLQKLQLRAAISGGQGRLLFFLQLLTRHTSLEHLNPNFFLYSRLVVQYRTAWCTGTGTITV